PSPGAGAPPAGWAPRLRPAARTGRPGSSRHALRWPASAPSAPPRAVAAARPAGTWARPAGTPARADPWLPGTPAWSGAPWTHSPGYPGWSEAPPTHSAVVEVGAAARTRTHGHTGRRAAGQPAARGETPDSPFALVMVMRGRRDQQM